MARSPHVGIIFTLLVMGAGSLLASLTPPAEEAAADDDEIALEDYVDNELPNFSGDLSSSVFGDGGGYDVHIEVKIANRSKSKDDNSRTHVSELLSPNALGSSQNHEKAKKILDLIIEKLKRRKDAKGASLSDDDTDIEISEKDDFVGETKAIHKKPDTSGTSNLFNDDIYGPITPAGDFADASKSKSDATDKHTASSLPKASEKHAFDLPEAVKTEAKEDEFSFKSVNSGRKAAQAIPELEMTHTPPPEKSGGESGESGKSTDKKWENTKGNKIPIIKISDDGEIRIKIPEILNKSSLVSKIVNIVNEDDKNRESEITNGARQALVNMESKLSEQNSYKLLLLKKLHENGDVNDQHSTPDVPLATTDGPSKETVSIINENTDSKPDQQTTKVTAGNNKRREPVKKKETAGDNLEDIASKKISKGSKVSNDESNDLEDVSPKKISKASKVNTEDDNDLEDIAPKKMSKASKVNTEDSNDLEDIAPKKISKGSKVSNDEGNDLEDIAPKKVSKGSKVNTEDSNDLEDVAPKKISKGSKVSNDESNDLEDIAPKMISKDSKVSNKDINDLEDITTKKISKVSKTEETNDQSSLLQGAQSEEKSLKDEETDKEADKVKQRNTKPVVQQEFHETPKHDAFVPNRVASKSFQENLEPDLEYKTFEATIPNPMEKKNIDIIPLDLRIDDIDPSEKVSTSAMLPKKLESNSPPVRQRKVESFTNIAPASSNQKYVQMQIVTMANENKPINLDDQGPAFNPGRLFNDSLFQQAGMDNSDDLPIDAKRKMEKPQFPTVSFNGDTNHDFKIAPGRKVDVSYSNRPIIDLLTFPSASEISSTMLENKRKATHPENSHPGEEIKQNKLHSANTHVATDHKHDTSYGHKKTPNMADSSHANKAHTFVNKDGGKDGGKGAPSLKDKVKPPNNGLPSTLFSDESSVAKSAKKTKNNKKPDNFALDLKDIKDSAASKANTKKLDLSDLESLQVQSKDSLQIGGNAQDDGAAGGEDDEYEDASGDEEDEEEEAAGPPNNTEEASLNNANLAIWKASEDIHALLHSLTDREHADRVLGNLKNFIKDKHGGVPHKRNSLGHKNNDKKEVLSKNVSKKSSGHKVKIKFPENLEVRKRSSIPIIHRIRKEVINLNKQIKKNENKVEKIKHVDKYTKLNGNGIDRLYNQLATSNSRIAPTFEDDQEGWSAEEVKNVMKQLKTSDLQDLSSNSNIVTAGYDDSDGQYSDNRRRVGLQANSPVSEENVQGIQAVPSLVQIKKDDNTQQKSLFPTKYKYKDENDDYGNSVVQTKGDSHYLFNSTVNFKNGDYIGVEAPSDNYDNNYLSRRQSEPTNT